MDSRGLNGHCTGLTGLFLLSLNDKSFALAVCYKEAHNYFLVYPFPEL